MDNELTVSNLLDRMARYAPDQEVFRFDDSSLKRYGVMGQSLHHRAGPSHRQSNGACSDIERYRPF